MPRCSLVEMDRSSILLKLTLRMHVICRKLPGEDRERDKNRMLQRGIPHPRSRGEHLMLEKDVYGGKPLSDIIGHRVSDRGLLPKRCDRSI